MAGATRGFFDLLLSERGAGIDWDKTDVAGLHGACHAAPAESAVARLTVMFAKILDSDAAYDV